MITSTEDGKDTFVFAGVQFQRKKSHSSVSKEIRRAGMSSLFHLTQPVDFLNVL